jgi:hypothetical protein
MGRGEVKTRNRREAWAAKRKLMYIITINVPVVYMTRGVMILMWAISITRAIGRGGLRSLSFQGTNKS